MQSTKTRDFLSGRLHQVDIQSIEKELYKLWDEAERDQEASQVTRACALNFIAFSHTGNGDINIEDIVSDISVKHPSRAIIARAEDLQSGEEALDAWVTARCHQVSGKPRQQICCEQIIVEWKGKGTRQLVSVVAPLTLPDLPTCLWWHDPVLNLDVIRPFLCHVDRFIVDSRRLSEISGANALLQLQNLKNATEKGSAVYDLNWVRLLPWRQALAESFDIKRGHLEIEDLDSISSVEIIEENGTDDGDGKVTAQSWLFLGWLASRLSWQFDRIEAADSNNPEAPTTIYYRLNRTAIKVKLRRYRDPQNHDNKGRLREIRIKLRNEEHSVLRVWPDSVSPGLRTALLNAHGNIDDEDISHNPKSQIDLIDSILNDPVKPRTFEEAVDAACAVLRRMRAK